MAAGGNYETLGYISELGSDRDSRGSSIIIDHNINYRETGSVNWDTTAIRGAIGNLYTYNYTNERRFTVALQIVDYSYNEDRMPRTESAKMLLRRWTQPKVTSGSDHSLQSPPPILLFKYAGLVGGWLSEDTMELTLEAKVVLLDYNIVSTELDPWKPKDAGGINNPAVPEVELSLAEVGVTFRNTSIGG